MSIRDENQTWEAYWNQLDRSIQEALGDEGVEVLQEQFEQSILEPNVYEFEGKVCIQTSLGCPEVYEVFERGLNIGYLRLRHGLFQAYAWEGATAASYEAEIQGDGAFEEHADRLHHLEQALKALGEEDIGPALPSPRV